MILHIVVRKLRRHPFLNLVKVTGLVLAFSSLLLISLYMKHELSYDRFHAQSERTYRFTATSPDAFGGKHFARIWGARYIPELSRTFPAVENFVRLSPASGGLIQWEEQKVIMQQAFFCDSTFLEIFDVELLLGDPTEALAAPSSVLVSENFARKIFGEENPVGQVLTIPAGRYYGEDTRLKVTGVMKDFPANSHLHPEFVATPPDPALLDGWAWTYLLLHPGTHPEGILEGFPSFLAEFNGTPIEDLTLTAHLQPLSHIHLRSKKTREIEANSNMAVIYSFGIAVLILLFIALVNYSMLNRGMLRHSDRLMFVGRVYGASRRRQLAYYFGEGSVIITTTVILSLLLALGAVRLVLNRFGLDLMEGNAAFALLILILLGCLGFAAGFLPQLRSYFHTLLVSARNTSGLKIRRKALSKGLIVFQYSIATILIVAVMVIQRQTTYALQSSMGAENAGIICMKHVHSSITERFPEFKESLLRYPSIGRVSGMLDPPGGAANDMFRFEMEGYEPDESRANDDYIGILPCDYSFPALFNLRFLAGNDFSEEFKDPDGSGEYIINASALERLGFQEPAEIIDREFQLFFHADFIQLPAGRVTGVVEDFHLSSLKTKIEALVLFKRDTMWVDNLLVSFQPGNMVQGLKDTEKAWKELFPGHSFSYDFVDEIYRQLYLAERLQASLLLLFTLVALFICSMGLLGLALLAAQQRTREIGIRRVNGASTLSLVAMLNRDFLQWILFSFALSLPLAWLAMRKWLESFTYQTELSWWIFLLAALSALLLSALPLSLQGRKAARRNPVEALRYE